MKKTITLSIAFGFLFYPFFDSNATVIHVPADQPTIQAGIDASVNGDTVLVADGTYTGDGNRDIDFGGKGIVLKSANGPDITIIDCQSDSLDPHRGFYFHSGEDSTAVIDGFTIQDGYGPFDGHEGYSVGGGIKCMYSSSPKITNNTISGNSAYWGGGIYCYHDSNPIINNNTISGNSAGAEGGGIHCDFSSNPNINNNNINGNSTSYGGGILCDIYSSPTISNNNISGNSAISGSGIHCFLNSCPTIDSNIISGNSATSSGGGILCVWESSPSINNNTIRDNSVGSAGGGILCEYISNPTISNNNISGNSANKGGGINCQRSSPTISNNTMSNNSASEKGGGIYCVDNSNPLINNNTINGNSATDEGGGIYCIINSSPTISNNTINGNSADFGGGIYSVVNSSPTISNNTITSNSAYNGGGIYCYNYSSPTINNNTISSNSASVGGGISCIESSSSVISNNTIYFNSGSEGIFCLSSNPTISNNTISRNGTYGIFCSWDTSPSLEKNIIAYNSNEAVYCQGESSNPVLTCCDVYGNEGGDWVDCIADQAGINGNFSADPLFCETATGNYHISSLSPCVPANNSCGVLIGALDVGCSPLTIIDPNPIYMLSANTIDTLYAKNLTEQFPYGYIASDINQSTLLINGFIVPTSSNVLTGHPDFLGEILEINFPLRDFILGYGFLYDTTVQTYTVSGEFNDATPFTIESEFTMIGHTSGDVNFDGEVDIADLVMFVDYLFNSGPAPNPIETGDVNRDGLVDIGDLVAMVEYMF